MDTFVFFTDEQAAKLADISVRRLRRWRSDVYMPEYPADDVGERPLNSFRDVVALRTLSLLRKQVPLQELRRVAEWLHTHFKQPWSSLKFSVAGKEVSFDDGSGRRTSVRPKGQKLLPYKMTEIVAGVETGVRQLFERSKTQIGRINPKGMLEGTRISAAAVQSFVEEGYTVDAILVEYPTLHRKDVEAAVAYSRARLKTKRSA